MPSKLKLVIGMALMAVPAMAAEPIQGNWKTAGGETVKATRCDKQFCLTIKTGEYAGKQIGTLSGDSIHYKGTITDPKDGKSYTGFAVVSPAITGPDTLQLKGCVLKVLCKSQEWERMKNE